MTLPASVAKLRIAEQAVRLVDAHNDTRLGVEARLFHIQTGVFCGCADLTLPAMAWVLAKVDDDPTLMPHDARWLMGCYKWLAQNLANFPAVQLETIENMLDDLHRRFHDHGFHERDVLTTHMWTYHTLGMSDKLRDVFLQAQTLPTSGLFDCPACVVNIQVQCHLVWDELDRALEVAEPLLSGEMKCAEIPFATFCSLLMPLYEVGQLDLANQLQTRAKGLIRDAPGCRGDLGEMLALLTLTDEHTKAVRLLDEHLSSVLAMTEVCEHMNFFNGAAVLMAKLRNIGVEAVTLQKHRGFEVDCDQAGQYSINDMAVWFAGRAKEIATQFDQRAGNRFRIGILEKHLARVDGLDLIETGAV